MKPPNISIRRLFALIKKEFYQIIRDPSSIMISCVLPLILLFLYGTGVVLDADDLKIGIVMEDTSPSAQQILETLRDSPYFDVKIARSSDFYHDDVVKGNIKGIVVIPSYFTAFQDRPPNKGPIQIISDGSDPNTANLLQNYVQNALQTYFANHRQQDTSTNQSQVKIEPRYWYNEELKSRNFLIPGSLAIIMTLIGTLLTALVVAREWERGTMESIMSTPVHIFELVMGKLIPYFILGMISMVICVFVSTIIYDVPLRGSLLSLMLCSAIFLLVALGQGLLISTIAKNQFVAAEAAQVTAFLPGFILSGFIFEIASMPKIIQYITYLAPAKYFVSCLQTLFLVGTIWELILKNLAILVIFVIVFFALTAKRTVKRLD